MAAFTVPPVQRGSSRLQLRHSRPVPSVVVVSVQGHVDASSAGTLVRYVLRGIGPYLGLVLDLREVEFFGTEAFWALHAINESFTPPSRMAVITSSEVDRVLALCVTQTPLLVAEDSAAAIEYAQNLRRPELRLIATG